MRAMLAVIALVWTLLLAVIALQLYQINQSLEWVSAPVRALGSMAATPTVNGRSETREERRARYRREQQAITEDIEDRLGLPIKKATPNAASTAPSSR